MARTKGTVRVPVGWLDHEYVAYTRAGGPSIPYDPKVKVEVAIRKKKELLMKYCGTEEIPEPEDPTKV